VFVALFGCKPKQQATERLTSEKYVEKDKLTPYVAKADSAVLKAQFRCDSLNRVLLMNLSEIKSANMSSQFSFNNGVLDYTSATDPDTVWIKSTNKYHYIYRNITKTMSITTIKTVKVEVPVRGVLWWFGLINFLVLVVYFLYKLITKTTIISVFKNLLKIK